MTESRQSAGREAEARRARLAQLLKERSSGAAAPLSYSQQRLWFFDQLNPGTAAYNIPLILRLTGRLDLCALEQSLTAVVRRHDVLRVVVSTADGAPVQRVGPADAVTLVPVDLTGMPVDRREDAARRIAEEAAAMPFDLSAGPLYRFTLVRLSDSLHALVIVVHHFVSDAWSLRILVEELTAAYAASASGHPAPLDELPIQYPEFARWQRQTIAGAALDAQVTYWRNQLSGAPAATELTPDRPRREQPTFRGAAQMHSLPAALAEQLRAFSRGEGVTLFMTLLAAFQLLLSRLAGQEDVVVGSPTAGRSRSETERLIGCFVNTLALRTDLSGDPAFTELVRRVRRTCLDAYSHEDLPFERLVEELQPQRELTRTPIFQVLFNMLVPQAERIELPDLTVECVHPEEDTSKFDVTMYAMDAERTIHLRLGYNADLFERESMTEVLAQFEGLLAQIAENPAAPISRYSLLTADARRSLPDPSARLPLSVDAPLVHDAFLAHVRLTPDRPAVHWGGESWTYAQLDAWSAGIAAPLRSAGFGREQVAVVYAARRPALVAALLGVARAGGAFTIVDPSYPASRIAASLDQVRPTAWIAAGGEAPSAELDAYASTLPLRCRIDAEQLAVRGGGDAVQVEPADVAPGDLAYVAFTSGSTGTPKAVLGTHGPIAHFMRWHAETFALSPADRVSMLSGLAHDPLLRDIFAPLAAGAAICIPDQDRLAWADHLFRWLADTGVTLAHMTPPLLRMIATSASSAEPLTSLRRVFFGGETLTGRDVRELRRIAPAAQAVNFYGTTETPQAMAWFAGADDVEAVAAGAWDSRPLPVGRGIDEVQLLVLTESGRMCGIGEPGEICVRTRHLARGYADAGNDRFIVNPFTGDAQDRMYRTGDLGRYDRAGVVEFLGRRDFQVKVRGYRVELPEIEAALRTVPGVHETLVLARGHESEMRLIAYARADEGVAVEHLRRAAAERLPDYMVPAAFVVVPDFPLTANGKIDRAALPVPDAARPALETAFVAPRTPIEQLIADVWSGLLGWRRVGVHDNFFALGGHSLLATRVIARLRDAFGINLPLRRLFQSPTVAGLAAAVQEQAPHAEASRPLVRVARDGDRPLSLAQERLWFIDRLDPGSAAYNMVGLARLAGALDVEVLRASFCEIVRRHEVLRTTFPEVDGKPVQRISPEVADPLTVVAIDGDAALQQHLRREAGRAFDLSREHPFRVTLFQTGPGDYVLLAVTHHIASDLWSIGVIVRELGSLYRARLAGRAADLPDLPVQYVDFAAWQREWLASGEFEAQLAYWREQLKDAPAALELPADRRRPAVQTQRGGRATFTWPVDLLDSAKAFGQREGLTFYMTLLAAFQTLVYRYTGREDVVIGTPIAGRARVELEALVGFFVNVLPLRTRLDGSLSFRELTARVRETCLGAYAHQDVPFDRLVQALRPDRDLSRSPIVQIVLALQNAAIEPLELPAGRLTPLEHANATALFDLAVFVNEVPDGLKLAVEYSTDLFDPVTIERLIGTYRRLLESALARPDAAIASLAIYSDTDRAAVTDAASGPRARIAVDVPVHRRVEEHARRRPEAIAVAGVAAVLTFAELNRRANRLARVLSRHGVGPERCAVVYMERSPEMIVALLAVLKTGGFYVPVDPAYPIERLSFTIADADAPVVLTQERLAPMVPQSRASVIVVPGAGDGFREQAETDLDVVASPETLAYAIYTSGSTGQPKGVQISHAGLLNLVEWHQRAYRITADDRSAQTAGVAFDASVWEIWPYLAAGASLALPERETLASPATLWTWLADNRITVVFAATPLAEALLAEPVPANLSLRALLTGGDRLTARVPPSLPFVLVNHYGPTENTVVSTGGEVTGSDAGLPPPIGRPIDNGRAYVVAGRGEPVPPGVVGELYVGGASLARGYLKRPDLTAERFLPDALSGEPGARLYRTGDLVRVAVDGQIHFVGRNDHQVKIRGFRIELGEIEARLAAHPGVRAAVAVVDEHASGFKRVVAYVVLAAPEAISPNEVRAWVGETLPEYMVPSVVVPLTELPLTANGKVDRRALPAPPADDAGRIAPGSDLERRIAAVWCEVLGRDRVGVADNFFDVGGHSLLLIRLHKRLSESLGVELSIVDLFQHPTIAALAARLAPPAAAMAGPVAAAAVRTPGSGWIAIVGMAGRFPQAGSVDALWTNLLEGREGISFFDAGTLAAEGIDPRALHDPSYVKARGVLDGAELFDARFFGYTPREAELIDPQHRIFLECAWEALEDAGYDASVYPGAVGVFAGAGPNTYLLQASTLADLLKPGMGVQLALSSEKDFLATRVAYKLGLRGPALTVQTACSTSLVAVHLARRSLMAGDCDIAIAGGVRITFPQQSGYLHQEGSIFSPDGHCRAFDAKAGGTVGGNGAAVLVLKRYEDAVRDGDVVHAVIKGSAVNNDGAAKVGYTAPGVDGQAEVIARAHAEAGFDPNTIGYVEAHGTGTSLGDPVEIAALTRAFRTRSDRVGFCAIGSLKSNIGHLDAAAGAAGLVKAALAVRHGVIPASLHYESANPAIDFANSPFHVNAARRTWDETDRPRRAGVSSFGLGGTNAHVVLEQPPSRDAVIAARPWQLVVLSAKSAAALDAATDAIAGRLREPDTIDGTFADVSYTLQAGRRRFDRRRFVVAQSAADAADALARRDARRVITAANDASRANVVFMFPGQGAQYLGMARGLYESDAAFRADVDACSATLEPRLGLNLRTLLYSDAAPSHPSLNETAIAQPALFTIEYALARLWMRWGIQPEALIGHSLGEFVAACLSGVFSVDDALRLVAERGRLMQAMPRGSMIVLALSEADARSLIGPDLSIAAVNGPAQCVISGPDAAVSALEAVLEARGIERTRLQTSHAFHSAMMDGALDRFRAEASAVRYSEPRIPYVSNVTGTWATAADAMSPDYWARHLRATVRFDDGISVVLQDPERALLEVGPGQALSGLARRAARDKAVTVIASMRRHDDSQADEAALLSALGRLWAAGAAVDWNAVHAGEQRHRVRLPTYPFEREHYSLIRKGSDARRAAAVAERRELSDWLYAPAWARTPRRSANGPLPHGPWLVFTDDGAGEAVADALLARGASIVRVRAGVGFAKRGSAYEIAPAAAGDYLALWQDLLANDGAPRQIVHLWQSSSAAADRAPSIESFSAAQEHGFHSLVLLAQAINQLGTPHAIALSAVTGGACDVTGAESLVPERATVLGACKVVPHDCPSLRCRAIDLDAGEQPSPAAADALIAEIAAGNDGVVALRRGSRWTPAFARITGASDESGRLRERGVYLITGGTGGVGLEIARDLARSVRARLALVSRRAVPARAEWQAVAGGNRTDLEARTIRQLLQLEALGADVIVLHADAAEETELRRAVQQTVDEFGTLHGVIHAAGADKSPVPLASMRRADAEQQFRARAHALIALSRTLEGRSLDFCAVQSSLGSVLGVVGHVAYTASHSFMDAFAAAVNRRSATPWLCINWDNWRTWKSEPLREGDGPGLAMAADEACGVFRRILALDDARQVIVSTTDLQARVDQWVGRMPASSTSGDEAPAPRHERPDLATGYVAPATDAERTLARIWEELLGVAQIGSADNFFELGGDSVIGIQIASKAAAAGLRFNVRDIFEHQTVAELAAAARSVSAAAPAASGTIGDAPLTPIQRWFFDANLPEPHYFNQSRLVEVPREIDASIAERAIAAVFERHDALRMRFVRSGSGWRQTAAPAAAPAFARYDVPGGRAEFAAAIERIAGELQRGLDVETGPVFRAGWIDGGPQNGVRLLLVAHHLVVDVLSWAIVLEELAAASDQLRRGQSVQLPRKTTSFAEWATRLTAHAGTLTVDADAAYWAGRPWHLVKALPRDFAGDANTEGSGEDVRVSLGADDTRRLLDALRAAGRLQPHDAVLGAAALACGQWSGAPAMLVDVEGHGREPFDDAIDLSRTVGWFTSVFPVLLELGSRQPQEAARVASREFRAVPGHGLTYGLLRYLRDDAAARRLRDVPRAEVSLLYLGRQDQAPAAAAFAAAAEPMAPNRSATTPRGYLLEISAALVGDRLETSWRFSRAVHRRDTIERVARDYTAILTELSRGVGSSDAARAVASFPAARLTDDELEDVLASFKRLGVDSR